MEIIYRLLARRLATLLLSVCASLTSVVATASTCGDLRRMEADTSEEMARLVAAYPGTHAVIAICAAVGSSEYEQTNSKEKAVIAFGVCALGACAVAGFDNCGTVTKEWFVLSMRQDQIKSSIRANGC